LKIISHRLPSVLAIYFLLLLHDSLLGLVTPLKTLVFSLVAIISNFLDRNLTLTKNMYIAKNQEREKPELNSVVNLQSLLKPVIGG